MSKDKRWEPVLKGEIYCSPACGCKCTKYEHDEAQRKAKLLVKKLGKGWKIRVWENGGWYYEVKNGDIVLNVHAYRYANRPTIYSAWYQGSPQVCGDYRKQPLSALKNLEAKLFRISHRMNEASAIIKVSKGTKQ